MRLCTEKEGRNPKYKQSQREREIRGKGEIPERHPKRNENLSLKIVHAEPNDCAAEVFTIQTGITALSKPRMVRMAFVAPNVLEVDDPQATALVAHDVPARQIAVDEP